MGGNQTPIHPTNTPKSPNPPRTPGRCRRAPRHYLRDKQLDGYKFRRQQPIGPYIVDFACMPQKLLIEPDGGQHAEQHTYDQKRDAFLREQGYTILRFWNNQIFEHCFVVLETIYEALVAPLSDHSPPHRISRRLTARLLRLPLKGGVMGQWNDLPPRPGRLRARLPLLSSRT